ncbi:hypothetical protein [Sphingomonas sp. 8AM]|uniref:hypothetical protein n=1 Tax=Sphingomonas sp. 8AM TaxID=2653170 RepID=UPI0012F38A03|nr:hypothetical protein [Sphingomonas sp. 8AM]VXC35651.1 hypothetical protein SPHINGO8AM_120071 [Sphingomonas sp. 8AM]
MAIAGALAVLIRMAEVVPVADRPSYPCWIASVAREGSGVRIDFAAGAPVRPGEESIHAEAGASLSPSNSGHDGCTLSVLRRGKDIGIEAEAHLFVPGIMTEPEVRKVWIVAR